MRYVIIGDGCYAEMLYGYIIESKDNEVVAFSAEEEFLTHKFLLNRPVVPYEEIEQFYNPEEVSLLLAVGYNGMNDTKQRLYNLYSEKGYIFGSYIHPSVILPSKFDLGNGNIFFEGVIIQHGCRIGTGNVFFVSTVVGHDCWIGDFNSFSNCSLAGRVQIQNNCFVGMGAVVGADVKISDHVFIGACAYVNSDVKQYRAVLGEKGKVIDREISKRIM